MPADSGHGHRLVPVAGGGRGCGHEILLAGAGVGSHYPRGYCPLPFLIVCSGALRLRDCTPIPSISSHVCLPEAMRDSTTLLHIGAYPCTYMQQMCT